MSTISLYFDLFLMIMKQYSEKYFIFASRTFIIKLYYEKTICLSIDNHRTYNCL